MTQKINKSVVTQKTNTQKKGGQTMTHKEALKEFILDYNRYQEYRANSNKGFRFINKEQYTDWVSTLTKDELDLLTKTYLIQRKFQEQLRNYITKEDKLNKAYGKEDIHPSELDQDTLDKMLQKQNKQQEFHDYKHQDDKAIYVANKAARKEDKENMLTITPKIFRKELSTEQQEYLVNNYKHTYMHLDCKLDMLLKVVEIANISPDVKQQITERVAHGSITSITLDEVQDTINKLYDYVDPEDYGALANMPLYELTDVHEIELFNSLNRKEYR